MRSTTFSQRLDKNDKRPDITVQDSQGLDHEMVIVTVGPNGGPFQTVYLTPDQARHMGASMTQVANEVEAANRWQPTHVSLHDGSTIRKVNDPGYGDGSVTFLAENENGDRDEYLAAEWHEVQS